jgi:hypothetical protein
MSRQVDCLKLLEKNSRLILKYRIMKMKYTQNTISLFILMIPDYFEFLMHKSNVIRFLYPACCEDFAAVTRRTPAAYIF